ncbi:ATP-binding protein [Halomonas sp. OfavH-34-E]|nr:ATP-binding protein [Halomonas sp. OfavH-34-E]MCO7217583.1 ATP-binding protein [Halomonas sp. OfavH-34-E]
MREPLESGEIHIARASHERRFPARFQLDVYKA